MARLTKVSIKLLGIEKAHNCTVLNHPPLLQR